MLLQLHPLAQWPLALMIGLASNCYLLEQLTFVWLKCQQQGINYFLNLFVLYVTVLLVTLSMIECVYHLQLW